jgi:hypothetical protein
MQPNYDGQPRTVIRRTAAGRGNQCSRFGAVGGNVRGVGKSVSGVGGKGRSDKGIGIVGSTGCTIERLTAGFNRAVDINC